MYENPVLFPAISNRETWHQIIQIADDQTGELISLTDMNANPLYAIYLEISPSNNYSYSGYTQNAGYYGGGCDPVIFASLADYISIVDIGTIQIQIPYTIIQKLHGNRTYNVYLRLEVIIQTYNITNYGGDFSPDFSSDFLSSQSTSVSSSAPDARQLLIGRLPILYGGRGQ